MHHIMSRGIEGCPIFRHEDDRWFFKALLEKIINSSPSKARRIIAFIANRKYRIPTGSIARYFEVTSSAVSNMVGDGEVLTQTMKIDY